MRPSPLPSLLSIAILLLGCDAADSASAGAKPAEVKAAAAAPPPAKADAPGTTPAAALAPPPADDSCRLTVTGTVSGEDVGRGGMMAVSSSYWFADGDGARNALFRDRSGAIINCNGTKLRLSIDLSGSADDVPLGPKVFEVGPARTDRESVATVLGTFHGASLMGPKGKVEILEFDRAHIKGKLELEGNMMGDGVSGPAKVVGDFAFKCAGLSGCR